MKRNHNSKPLKKDELAAMVNDSDNHESGDDDEQPFTSDADVERTSARTKKSSNLIPIMMDYGSGM